MKSVIMVGGGIQEVPAIERIKKMGYTAIVTDMNRDAPGFKKADIGVNISARDVQSLIAWILLKKKELNIKGIFTLINQAQTVSIVASATGLPSLPVETVVRCDNKLLMKRCFKEHNLPTANFREIHTITDAIKAYEEFGNKKMYLKVVDGFGGKGIQTVGSIQEIKTSVNLLQEITNFPCIIAEEALSGAFIDIQGFMHEGLFYPAGSADSFFTNSEERLRGFNPVEDFNVSPSQQPIEIVNDAYSLLENAAHLLGISWGPVGGDLILTKEGLKIIEIGTRLHGPNGTLQIFPAATGIKPFEFLIQCVCGEKPDPDLLKKQFDKVALCKVFVSEKFPINKAYFIKDPLTIPGIFAYHLYWNKHLSSNQNKSLLSGLAGVFIIGNTYNEAMKIKQKVEDIWRIS